MSSYIYIHKTLQKIAGSEIASVLDKEFETATSIDSDIEGYDKYNVSGEAVAEPGTYRIQFKSTKNGMQLHSLRRIRKGEGG